jgi:hypothetical protein
MGQEAEEYEESSTMVAIFDELQMLIDRMKDRCDSDFYFRMLRRMLRKTSRMSKKDARAKLAGARVRVSMLEGELEVLRAKNRAHSYFEHQAEYGNLLSKTLIDHLKGRASKSGAKGAEGRWEPRDRTRDFALELWASKKWQSRADFARRVAAQVVAKGKEHGFQMVPDNAERTILDWLREASRPTPATEA